MTAAVAAMTAAAVAVAVAVPDFYCFTTISRKTIN
jgi:hypothetical protein